MLEHYCIYPVGEPELFLFRSGFVAGGDNLALIEKFVQKTLSELCYPVHMNDLFLPWCCTQLL